MPKKTKTCTHCGVPTTGLVHAGGKWQLLCPKCTGEWWDHRDAVVKEAFEQFTSNGVAKR